MYCQLDQPTNILGMALCNADWEMLEDTHVCGSSNCTPEALNIPSVISPR